MAKKPVLVQNASLRILLIALIGVDPTYQRGIVKGHERILKNFDPNALGSVLVAERKDGSLWVVDGLQRLTVLKAMEVTKVRAEVFASDGPEHEARVFGEVNGNRTRLTTQNLFHAALVAGNPVALDIKRIVEAAGFKLPKGSKNDPNADSEANNLRCYFVLKIVYGQNGPDGLGAVVQMLKDAWPGDPQRTKDFVLGGLAAFGRRHEWKIDVERLVARLNTTTPAKLKYSAGMGVGSRYPNVADVIEKLYRKRLYNK